jgi:hypothetical protein
MTGLGTTLLPPRPPRELPPRFWKPPRPLPRALLPDCELLCCCWLLDLESVELVDCTGAPVMLAPRPPMVSSNLSHLLRTCKAKAGHFCGNCGIAMFQISVSECPDNLE